jgi:RNA polymerase sigma-70 factor (ECF subfamily)
VRLHSSESESRDQPVTPVADRTVNGFRPLSPDVESDLRARLTLVESDEAGGTHIDTHIDDVTFGEIVRDHGPVLRRFVARRTFDDQQLADDIVQETMLRLWKRPQTLRTNHASLRPWLCTVARNLLVDHWRARRARPIEIDDVELANVASSRDAMDEADWRRDMAQAVGKLRPEHRAVIALLYYRGLHLKEAATELGVPLGTVKSRTFYALRELRTILDDMGVQSNRPGYQWF